MRSTRRSPHISVLDFERHPKHDGDHNALWVRPCCGFPVLHGNTVTMYSELRRTFDRSSGRSAVALAVALFTS